MNLYDKILNNDEYLDIARKIGEFKFISDGKWDWEHGLGHFERVASYAEKILNYLNADERTIELCKIAALLHDLGMATGEKPGHAYRSSEMFNKFLSDEDITIEEREIIRQAILDHSKGEEIKTLVGLALCLADKLDVTYHRVINSSIHDEINNEIMKIQKVNIEIDDDKLILTYNTTGNFNVDILKYWDKAITVPKRIAGYLNKSFLFIIDGVVIDKF